MAESDAERSRRSRRHRAGDHTLCVEQRCKLAGQGPVTFGTPRGVTRGEALWRDMSGDSLPPPQRLILQEACRIADRLDVLDDFLEGRQDSWLRFHARNEDGSIVTVVVDKALGEARQQQAVLKQLIADLRAAGAATTAPSGKVAGVADLASFAAARSAKSTG